jgi:hypothetical protein
MSYHVVFFFFLLSGYFFEIYADMDSYLEKLLEYTKMRSPASWEVSHLKTTLHVPEKKKDSSDN